MNAIISEKSQPIDESKLPISQVSKEQAEGVTQDEHKMKDKKRIDSFIEKHKSLLIKLAK